jgi:hypothetical protein
MYTNSATKTTLTDPATIASNVLMLPLSTD